MDLQSVKGSKVTSRMLYNDLIDAGESFSTSRDN